MFSKWIQSHSCFDFSSNIHGVKSILDITNDNLTYLISILGHDWSKWTSWTKCNFNSCTSGSRSRTRYYMNIFACVECAYEKQSEECRKCDHLCDKQTGRCTCRNGYSLSEGNTS